MDQDRFAKKRNSLVGGGLAKFEGAEAAEQFARRQSSYHTRVRQSIPDIRFDEHGMPISTRQLQARSHSLAGGSLFPTDRRYSRDGLRRGSDFIPAGGEKNVRKLSKKFSSEEEEELKANFTIPENTRAGMFGSNSRWSVKPEWMKKRRSSTKEEFIEKNLSNLEMLSPTSPKEEEMASISEELVPSSEQQNDLVSDNVIDEDDTGNMEDNSSSSETTTGSSSDEDYCESDEENYKSDCNISETDIEPKRDVEKNTEKEGDSGDEKIDVANQDEAMVLKHAQATLQEKPRKSRKKTRKSKKSKKSRSNADLPTRPPPPPLPIQMCDITQFQDELSSSDEDEDTIRTQYGKQKMFVSKCYHVFETTNGPLNEDRD